MSDTPEKVYKKKKVSTENKIRGILFILLLLPIFFVLNIYIGFTVIAFDPFIHLSFYFKLYKLSMFLSKIKRYFLSWSGYIFFLGVPLLFEYILNIKIKLYSNDIECLKKHQQRAMKNFSFNLFSNPIKPSNEDNSPALIVISNHRTRIDWMIYWSVAALIPPISTIFYPFLSIILKADIRNIPLMGWTLQFLHFIFLSRNRENDLPHIEMMIKSLTSVDAYPSLLFFPEGTDLNNNALASSNRFADKIGVPHTQYTLLPKTGAAQVVFNKFRKKFINEEEKGSPDVLDLTMAYVDHSFGHRTSELSLVKGEIPSEIHINLNFHRLRDIPSDEKEMSNWLFKNFNEKEIKLKQFYEFLEDKEEKNETNITQSSEFKDMIKSIFGEYITDSSKTPLSRRILPIFGVFFIGYNIFSRMNNPLIRYGTYFVFISYFITNKFLPGAYENFDAVFLKKLNDIIYQKKKKD